MCFHLQFPFLFLRILLFLTDSNAANTCIHLSSCFDAFLFSLNVLSDADFWDGSIEGIVPRRTVTSAS